MLHRMMPEVMIKRTTLSRIYKEHKIKFKVIKKVKVIPECSRDWAERAKIDCRNRIAQYKKDGVPIVFCDESVLSSKLLPSHAWMGKGKNVEIDEKLLNAKTIAFVVALSEDKGLVCVDTFPRSLDKNDFLKFIKHIRKIYGE